MNDSGQMHDMAPPPPPAPGGASSNCTTMMQITCFLGKNIEILFDRWPGCDCLPRMYMLALALVFFLAIMVEWLSQRNNILLDLSSSDGAVRLQRTLLYTGRIGFAYHVIVAVMYFDAGVFVAALAGHGTGFFFFGSRDFNESIAPGKNSDLPAPIKYC